MSSAVDLTGFVPMPYRPSYLVGKDGRVWSHKKEGFLHEVKRRTPGLWRVRIGFYEYRVRDLVLILHGHAADFEERAQRWIEETMPLED